MEEGLKCKVEPENRRFKIDLEIFSIVSVERARV